MKDGNYRNALNFLLPRAKLRTETFFAATVSRQELLIDGGWTVRQGGDNVLKGHGLRGFPLGNEFGENLRDLLFLLLSRDSVAESLREHR